MFPFLVPLAPAQTAPAIVPPRLVEAADFDDADIKLALRMLCSRADPAYTIEIKVPLRQRVTITFAPGTELEDAIRAALTRAGAPAGYRFDTAARRLVIEAGSLPTRKTFQGPRPIRAVQETDDAPRRPELVLPWSHTEDITGIAPAPTGRLVATSGAEGTIVLWENGRLLRSFSGQISRAPFDPSGKVLYAARDREALAYEVATGRIVGRKGYSTRVLAVSAAQTGAVLVSLDNGTVETFAPRLQGSGAPLRAVAARFVISSSGRFAVGVPTGGDRRLVPLLDIQSKTVSRLPLPQNELVSDAAISPDDRWLAAGSERARVVLFRLADRTPVAAGLCAPTRDPSLSEANLNAPGANFVWTPASVAFSPDSRALAGSGESARIAVWDLGANARVADLAGHNMRYYNLGCSALAFGGATLYSGSREPVQDDERLKLWDWQGQRLLGALRGAIDSITRIAFSQDSDQLIAQTRGNLQLWDTRLKEPPRRLQASLPAELNADGFLLAAGALATDSAVPSVLAPETIRESIYGKEPVAPSGAQQLALAARYRKLAATPVNPILIYDVQSRARIHRLRPYAGVKGRCKVLAFHPDGLHLAATGWDDNAIYLFHATAETALPLVGEHRAPVSELLFSPGGRYLVSRGVQGARSEIRIWDVARGAVAHRPESPPPTPEGDPEPPPTPFRDLPFEGIDRLVTNAVPGEAADDATPQRLAVAATKRVEDRDERTVRVYDLETGALRVGPIPGQDPRFGDSRWLYVVRDDTLEAWDTTGREATRTFPGTGELLATRPGVLVCRAPNGRDLVVWIARGDTWVWKILSGHASRVETALFDPRDGRLWSAARDGTIRFWSVGAGEIATLVLVGPSDYLVALADQRYVATRGALRSVAFRVGERTYPFEQFDLYLNRPDIVLERLGSRDADLIARKRRMRELRLESMKVKDRPIEELLEQVPTLELTGAEPPPTVTGRASLTLSVAASDRTELRTLRVLVNGSALPLPEATTRLSGTRAERTVDVPLIPGPNRIQLSVFNHANIESLRLVRTVALAAPPRPPSLFVVCIGVSLYANDRNLEVADRDAADLASLLRRLGPAGKRPSAYRAVPPPLVLRNQKATREAVLREVPRYLRAARPEDQVIVYFAGHGTRDPVTLEYRFATHDWDTHGDAISRTTLSLDEIDALLAGCPARQKLLLLDTCFAGRVIQAGDEATPGESARWERDIEEGFADLETGSGAEVIAATTGREQALEQAAINGQRTANGAFAIGLQRAFDPSRRGGGRPVRRADVNRDGRISAAELYDFVAREVRTLTEGRQLPTRPRQSLDYDFALLAGYPTAR